VPGSQLDNPVVVSLLGLLLEQPRHLYALAKELANRADANGLSLGRGSVRNALEAAAAVGWVRKEDAGDGRARAVFHLTDEGATELRRRVEAQLRDATPDHDHAAQAIAYLGLLGPGTAADVLTRRADDVARQIAATSDALDEALALDVLELHVVEAGYVLALRRAEHAWLTATADRIRSGALAWPTASST
jgi:DNA-binding PadR family transcriptional regulator